MRLLGPDEIYQEIFENSPQGIMLCDPEFAVTWANQRACDLLRQDFSALEGLEWYSGVGISLERALEMSRDALHHSLTHTEVLCRADQFIRVVVSPATGGLLVYLDDVTYKEQLEFLAERHQSELSLIREALQESEERFHLAVSAANEGIWEAWGEGRILFGGEWFNFLGFSNDDRPHTFKTWLRMIVPEDRYRVLRYLRGEIIHRQNDHISVEYRIRSRLGEIHFVRAEGRVMQRDVSGGIRHVTGVHKDVTDMRQLEGSLLRIEKRLRQFLDNFNGVAFITNAKNQVIAVNQEALRLSHFQGLVNENHPVACESFWPEEVSKEICRQNEQLLKKPEEQNYQVSFSAGSRFTGSWLFVRFPVFDDEEHFDLGGICVDTTPLDKARQALEESEERYRTLIEMGHNGVLLHVPDHVLYANPAALDIFETSNVEKLNSALEQLFGSEEAELLWQKVLGDNREITNLEATLEIRLPENKVQAQSLNNPMKTRYLSVSMRQVRLRKNPAVLTILQDITDRKLQEKLEKKHQQQMMQADKLIALGTLVAGVAHEVNNPNSAITFNAATLREMLTDLSPLIREMESQGKSVPGGFSLSEISEEMPKLAKDIENAASRIKHITQELKRFAAPQENPSAHEPIQLNQVVESALDLLGKGFRKRALHVDLVLENTKFVKGNFQRLEQVVINFLSNAADALESPHKKITIRTWEKRGKIALEVEDEGTGIPAEIMQQITNPFFSTKRGRGGTGLGLSVCQSIANEHGALLQIESEEGKGTVMRLLF